MPTPSKAHKAVLIIQESAKIAAAAGIDYPEAQDQAVDAYRALNALAEKIRTSASAKGRWVEKGGGTYPLSHQAEKQEGGG